MNPFNSTQNDIEGFLLNFDQQEPYVDNSFIGLIEESKPLRGDHLEYRYYPGDAKDPERSQQLQMLKPKEYNVIEYPQGMISPQPVTIVLPDMQSQLPKPVKSGNYGGTDTESANLGVVLGRIHYQNQVVLKAVREVADRQPDMLDRMKQVAVTSRLDEAEQQEMIKTLDEVMGAVDRNRNSGSSS